VFVRLARIVLWLIIGIITLAAIGATDQIIAPAGLQCISPEDFHVLRQGLCEAPWKGQPAEMHRRS
jgi:hypothetical protein